MQSSWHPMHSAQYNWNKSSLANILPSCLGGRIEMAYSVEARTPFLDHHLIEYVNKLPPSVISLLSLAYRRAERTRPALEERRVGAAVAEREVNQHPNLSLSPEERRYFGQLFTAADTDKIGVVTGEVAVKFFEKTRLPPPTLGEVCHG
ncbi:MAG: hypothetical protein Q9221_008584 [Calogaya cf. arnoldii]